MVPRPRGPAIRSHIRGGAGQIHRAWPFAAERPALAGRLSRLAAGHGRIPAPLEHTDAACSPNPHARRSAAGTGAVFFRQVGSASGRRGNPQAERTRGGRDGRATATRPRGACGRGAADRYGVGRRRMVCLPLPRPAEGAHRVHVVDRDIGCLRDRRSQEPGGAAPGGLQRLSGNDGCEVADRGTVARHQA